MIKDRRIGKQEEKKNGKKFELSSMILYINHVDQFFFFSYFLGASILYLASRILRNVQFRIVVNLTFILC